MSILDLDEDIFGEKKEAKEREKKEKDDRVRNIKKQASEKIRNLIDERDEEIKKKENIINLTLAAKPNADVSQWRNDIFRIRDASKRKIIDNLDIVKDDLVSEGLMEPDRNVGMFLGLGDDIAMLANQLSTKKTEEVPDEESQGYREMLDAQYASKKERERREKEERERKEKERREEEERERQEEEERQTRLREFEEEKKRADLLREEQEKRENEERLREQQERVRKEAEESKVKSEKKPEVRLDIPADREIRDQNIRDFLKENPIPTETPAQKKIEVVVKKVEENKSKKKGTFLRWVLIIIGILVAIVIIAITAGVAIAVYFIVKHIYFDKKIHAETIDGESVYFEYKKIPEKTATFGLIAELKKMRMRIPIRTISVSYDNKFDTYDADRIHLVPSPSGDVMLYAFIQMSVMSALQLNQDTTAKIKRFMPKIEKSDPKQFIAMANAIVLMHEKYNDLSAFLVTEPEKQILENISAVKKFLEKTSLDIMKL